jgi:general secretion pathway protein F
MLEAVGYNGADGGLTAAEAAQLSDQIADLTRAGLPLSQGLVALGAELPRGRLRESMNELARTLESGAPLERAIEGQGGKIPHHLRGLVIAGVRTGRLGDLLNRFSAYVGIGAELKHRLWLGLMYPALTAALAFLLFVLLCSFVVRQFETIYSDFGIALPMLTQMILEVARVVNSAIVPLGIVGLAVLSTWLAARFLLTRPARRSLAGKIPVLGPVWRTTSLAEFSHLLALLLESDIPLPEALRLTGEGTEDAELEASCGRMAAQVESGRPLWDAMKAEGRFPPGLSNLLRWADGQRSLTEVLHMAGSMFEARARSRAAFAGTVLSVLCIFPVFSVVLFIPALFLPLFTLISRLSG